MTKSIFSKMATRFVLCEKSVIISLSGGQTESDRGVFTIYFRTEYWQSSDDKGAFQIPEMKKYKMMLLQHRILLFDQNDGVEVFQKCQSVGNREEPLPLLAYLITENSKSLIRFDYWCLAFTFCHFIMINFSFE